MTASVSKEQRLKEPQPPEDLSLLESVYNDRHFYSGQGMTSGSDRAELTYLRDWKRWAEQQLRGYASWERSVNEALNSGDGSYRP